MFPWNASRGLPAPTLFGASFPDARVGLLRGAGAVGLRGRRARVVAAAVGALGRVHVAGARIRLRLARAGSSRAGGGHQCVPPDGLSSPWALVPERCGFLQPPARCGLILLAPLSQATVESLLQKGILALLGFASQPLKMLEYRGIYGYIY